MKGLRIIGLAIALSALAACGGSPAEEDSANVDNLVLDSENLDVGLNAADPALNGVDDLNAVDANAVANADDAAATNEATTNTGY